MRRSAEDSPKVIAFPPLLYVSTLGVGILAHLFAPVHVLPAWPARIIGAVLFLVGAFLGKWGERTLLEAGTNVDPRDPSTAVVDRGPYRFTRNPLYVAITLIYTGVALLVNALWPLVLLVPLLAVMRFGVVQREERYLERKFGAAYTQYRSRVRRWI